MKYILIILLSSCTRYQWVATETKISTVGQKIHIEQIGKPVPIGDTTIRGMIITKKRMYVCGFVQVWNLKNFRPVFVPQLNNEQMMPYNVQPYLHKALCYAFGRL